MIRVDRVSKSYGEVNALSDVSFEVPEGILFGLIGPDGAGKSTLMRIIVTLLLPGAGSVSVFGRDTVKDYRYIRRHLGYMPGRFSLYPDLTVEENLRFYATVFGTTIRENYDLVKDIYSHIEPFRKRRAGQLSGGMKQKLALSCALIHRPKLLVLDEPTTGVDAVSRREFWEMLKNLQKEGISILVSTAYMDEAALCDRVVLMQSGSILDNDTPQGIIRKSGMPLYSIQTGNMYKLITDLRGWPKTGSVFAFGQEAHFTFPEGVKDQAGLEVFLADKGHTRVKIREIQPGIEDVFIHLMQNHKNI
jgi:ABC-2 type transport system ATP-binding protein